MWNYYFFTEREYYSPFIMGKICWVHTMGSSSLPRGKTVVTPIGRILLDGYVLSLE